MDSFLHADSPYFVLALFAIGLISGCISSMGGSGGLILLPFMILSGLPPATALGTARLAAIGGWLVALRKFKEAGQVRWSQVPLITVLVVAGGTIGTLLVLDMDERYIYPIVGTIMIAMSPLAFLKKDFGLTVREHSKLRNVTGYFLYFLVMIYGGFFGGGTGVMSMFVLVSFLGYRFLEAHATEIAPWIIMSVVSSAIFIAHGRVDYFYALVVFLSMVAGSFIGSHIALKGGDQWVRSVVSVFAFFAGVKLLFFTGGG